MEKAMTEPTNLDDINEMYKDTQYKERLIHKIIQKSNSAWDLLEEIGMGEDEVYSLIESELNKRDFTELLEMI